MKGNDKRPGFVVQARAVVGSSPGPGQGKTKSKVDLDQAVLSGGNHAKETAPAIVKATAETPVPQIDPALAAFIPRPTAEEQRHLKEDLGANGCREPITVWRQRNLIVDGNTRWPFIQELGLAYSIRYMDFPDEEAAKQWMMMNQLGRRNLSPEAASYFRGLLYQSRKRRQGERTDQKNGKNAQNPTTAEVMGEEFKVNEKTIRLDSDFAEALEKLAGKHGAAIRAKVLAGDVKGAKTVVEKLVKMPAIEQRRAVKQVVETGALPKPAAESGPPSSVARLNAAWDKADRNGRRAFLRSKAADGEFVELVRAVLPEEENEEEEQRRKDQEIEETEGAEHEEQQEDEGEHEEQEAEGHEAEQDADQHGHEDEDEEEAEDQQEDEDEEGAEDEDQEDEDQEEDQQEEDEDEEVEEDE